MIPAHPDPSFDIVALLERQRSSFLKEGAPTFTERKARLKRLRTVVLAHRRALGEAISADFGHRSRHETDILEVLCVVQAIDYLGRNLRHFMKRERRHVGLFYRVGSAYVQYQPKGVIGVMKPEPVQVFKTHVSDQGSIKAEMVENLLTGNLCFAVQRTNRIISRQINDALRSTGLTAEQIFLLAAIGEAGSPRISEVSLLLGLDHSTVVSNLKPLLRKNWVTMSVDVDDRRARRLLLTDNGSARLAMAFERLQELGDALMKKVGGTQNTLGLCRMLGALSTACA